MAVGRRLIVLWLVFGLSSLPQPSSDPTIGPLFLAPFAQGIPRTLFDEPIYYSPEPSEDDFASNEVGVLYVCEPKGPQWVDVQPGPTRGRWPG